MKHVITLLAAFLLAVPASAANARKPQLKAVKASSLTVHRIADARTHALRVLRQSRTTVREGIGTDAISGNRSARALVIPAAGNVPGASGTHFRSDITFANWNNRVQNLGVMWLPNGAPNDIELFTVELPANTVITGENFVGDALDLEGLGALVLLPLTPDDDFDENGAIDAYSRIWTPQPNASGTVSQPFPAVDPSFLTDEMEGVVLGLRQDAQFRTNFGIVNISDQPLTFQVAAMTEDVAAPPVRIVTVQPLSMIQQGMQAGSFGQLSLNFTITSTPSPDFTWISYASSTDNTTGDGWVSIAANRWDDTELEEDENTGGQ